MSYLQIVVIYFIYICIMYLFIYLIYSMLFSKIRTSTVLISK